MNIQSLLAVLLATSEEDTIETLEKLAAEHREHCEGCRAEYEAQQAKKTGEANAAAPAPAPAQEANAAAPSSGARMPIGYVAVGSSAKLNSSRVLLKSVRATREEVEADMQQFMKTPGGVVMQMMFNDIKLEIKPIFID